MKRFFVFMLTCCLLLSGCSGLTPINPDNTDAPTVTNPTAPGVDVDLMATDEDMFTDRDMDSGFSESDSVVISLEGDRASCGAASVRIEGSHVTITGKGTYILRGTLNDGWVTVDAEGEKTQLVLDGVSITSSDNAALRVENGKKVFITLVKDSQNHLTSNGFAGGEGNGVDGAVFSRQDLTFNGSGSLTVTSEAGHGIVCKDNLVITGGTYTVNSAGHGIDANDSVRIRDGVFSVDAGKDGIHSEETEDATLGIVYISGGSMKLETEGDGISAEAYLQMTGGSVEILAGGGYENGASHSSGGWGDFMGGGGFRPGGRAATETEEAGTSMKGMKAAGTLLLAGGTVKIDSADDGLHSNGTVTLAGGELTLASGDDGIHGETTLRIAGGRIDITQSYEGLEAKDILIDGGEISMVATDDGLNAAGGTDSSGEGGRDQMFGRPGGMGGASDGSIVINGGTLNIRSSGDGMDANGTLEINDGYIVVCGPNSGDTATLDFDVKGTINGGTFIGTGASFMPQSFSDNKQGVIAIRMGSQSAGTEITVTDGNGKELVKTAPELDFSVFIFSSPELVSGQSYRVAVGGVEDEIDAY